ncbi:MAG: TadE/TadG family type IV pilus assembly protein [Sphingobium phenoxybenzoativorans]
MAMLNRLKRLPKDERGLYVTEFALVAPVFLITLLGTFDMAHGLYMQTELQGIIQKAARDLTLESGTEAAKQAALDASVEARLKNLAKNATVTFSRRNYKDFTKAAQAVAEPYTDTNANGRCDAGEPYQDNNNNSVWDKDGGDDGQGGAKDNVVYTVSVSYPRMFKFSLIGLPATTTMQASTVLANQPYGDQSQYAAPTARNCT